MRCLTVVAVLACAASAEAQPLSWGLNGGSDGWPAAQRDTITRSMNEAVALYNKYGVFEKRVTANYNAGVPTAEGNYDGFISFGGSNNTRVALHEIAHTLGVGTYRPFNGGTWDEKGAAGKLVKLFDGEAATISTGGTHFWPYGLNYDNEDNPGARERHVKLVAALRFDMGIVGDSDRDGMPDDWEKLHFEGLSQGADGDADEDGITNADEYDSDSDPNVACPVRDGHTYVVRTQASERVLTLQNDLQVKQYVGNPVQHWTAHYAGGGFWRFETSGQVLQMEGNDTASGRPLKVGAQTDAASQLWRVVAGIGAKPDYWQLANKATGKLADCLPGGAEDAAVQQWPYMGNISQQFWTFEDTGANEGGGKSDAGVPPVLDASVPRDAGARGDAAVSTRDAGIDAGRTFVDAGDLPSETDDAADAPTFERDGGGCALGGSTSASWLLLGLGLLLRRRPRRS